MLHVVREKPKINTSGGRVGVGFTFSVSSSFFCRGSRDFAPNIRKTVHPGAIPGPCRGRETLLRPFRVVGVLLLFLLVFVCKGVQLV